MTSAPEPRTPGLSRRGFLKATIVAGVVLVAEASPVTAHAAAA